MTPTHSIKSIRRIRQAGMTLVEIMIVIVIMALIGTGVTLALLPALDKANRRTTRQGAETVRSAVMMYRAEHPRGCPDTDDLMDGDYLDRGRRTTDAWDLDFEITCDGRDVQVISAGADGEFGSEDDVGGPNDQGDD